MKAFRKPEVFRVASERPGESKSNFGEDTSPTKTLHQAKKQPFVMRAPRVAWPPCGRSECVGSPNVRSSPGWKSPSILCCQDIELQLQLQS